MIDERDVREMLRRRAGAIQAIPSDPGTVTRKARRRVFRTGVAGILVIAALSAAVVGGVRAIQPPPIPASPPTPIPTPTETTVPTPDPSPAVVVDIRSGDRTPLPASITSLHASDISVSSGGGRLTFVAGLNGDVYTANVDGTDVRRIAEGVVTADPVWSPDGTQIAYTSAGRVYVVDIASGSTAALTGHLGDVWGPTFTPDGRAVIFTTADRSDPGWQWLALSRVSVSGGPVSSFMRRAAAATFSPDGTELAFVCIALPGDGHLWLNEGVGVANSDGTDRRRLPGFVPDPRCDGGGGEVGLFWDGDVVWRPTWSPDGTRIAWVDVDEISIVDVRTGEVTTVARGTHPSWIDEHTLIVER